MDEALLLLKDMIATPSFSGEEDGIATILVKYMENKGWQPQRYLNNVWAFNAKYNKNKPTLLLNSHHDTVKPSPNYTRSPFEPYIENDKLYGLGSNDAGASVVCLLQAFGEFYNEELPFNLIIAITAEEEAICKNGISALLPKLGKIDYAIVGEPTGMQAAIAERGLVVLDCIAKGTSGHAARNEGDNALYNAVDDIQWFRTFQFPKVSELMGNVKMTVTQIQAGSQHNVIPAECNFVIDIRPTDMYTNQEIVEIVQSNVKSEVKPRSLNLNASSISNSHILVKTAKILGLNCYISPTTSDIARLPISALKMGPGDSARSHTADEFIYIKEINEGINEYFKFLKELKGFL